MSYLWDTGRIEKEFSYYSAKVASQEFISCESLMADKGINSHDWTAFELHVAASLFGQGHCCMSAPIQCHGANASKLPVGFDPRLDRCNVE